MRNHEKQLLTDSLVFLLIVGVPLALRAASTDPPKDNGAQGSFRPPVASQNTDSKYVAATGLVATAGPITVFGLVLGTGHGFGDAQYPYFGYEATIDVERGSGTLAGTFPASFGGPDLKLGFVQGGGSATIKFKPWEARDNGVAGLLLYGTANLGLQQMATTTTLGTAASNSMQIGVNAGALVEAKVSDIADLMVFAGYRVNSFVPFTVGMNSMTMKTPEYGGDATFHLPYDLSLSISSVFSIMHQGDKDQGVKIYLLGLIWEPGVGVSPTIDGGTP